MSELDLKTPVGDFMVSTVNLLVNHGDDKLPLWYETYIFPAKNGTITNWIEVWGTRYSTEAEALVGHVTAVNGLRDGTLGLH